MKIRIWLVIVACGLGAPFGAFSQCGTIHTITYDTVVTGGGSNVAGYAFSVPKFNPALGTLTSVNLKSVVTLQFAFTIENMAAAPGRTKVRVERTDSIFGPTSTDTLANDYFSGQQTSNLLAPTDGVPNSGPDWQAFAPYYIMNNTTVLNQTTSNVAPYLGTGNLGFTYKSDIGSLINGNPNVVLTGSASDVIHFSVTYTYCDNILLATDITSFSASKKQDYISLIWVTSGEVPNHVYEVQKSTNGRDFVSIGTVASHPEFNQKGSYEYHYTPQPGENEKLYFRIRLVLPGGGDKYSPVRLVDLTEKDSTKVGIRITPNPSSGGAFAISLLNNNTASDWDIELFNIRGQVISKKQATNTTLAKFAMTEYLSSGVYFVLVSDRKTGQKYVERLVVN